MRLSLATEKNHSCESALIKLVNDVQIEIEQNKLAVILMLDQSAAFDTVDLSILLRKLEANYGICDDALEFVSSFVRLSMYVNVSIISTV